MLGTLNGMKRVQWVHHAVRDDESYKPTACVNVCKECKDCMQRNRLS